MSYQKTLEGKDATIEYILFLRRDQMGKQTQKKTSVWIKGLGTRESRIGKHQQDGENRPRSAEMDEANREI
jgi:hypothetical protein